jgi:tetratricopeptide (TPR) repeat protein
MTRHTLQANIETLRRLIRTGDFSNVALLKRCWDSRGRLARGTLDSLRLHTLAWEMHHARGEYGEATDCLRDRGEIEAATEIIYEQSRRPDRFADEYFPRKLSPKARESQDALWRQRVMGVLAMAADEFLLDDNRREEMFNAAQKFLEECLAKAGFRSVGTRSRLHYFRGNRYAANYEHALAAAEYDRSLAFCIARADERMRGKRDSSQFEVERSFAVYCLGKLELAFGQLDFHRGHLDSAKRHAKRAGLLLQTSRDTYLPHRAQVLVCLIERYENNFGWDLVNRMCGCRDNLEGHAPYQLEATIEAVKTCVYLRNEPRPPKEPNFLSLPEALKQAIVVAGRAKKLGLKNLEFHALLVKARTLNRLNRFEAALKTVDEATKAVDPHIPKPMQAEASFVKGKIHATRGAVHGADEKETIRMLKDDEKAYLHFQNALDAGGASVTFRISCRLQISGMLLRLGRVIEARNLLADGKKDLESVQHTFLHERITDLEKRIEESKFSEFRYSLPHFSLDKAHQEMEKKFLLAIERETNLPPHEFLHNFRKIEPLLNGLSRERLERIIKDHFPLQKQAATP